MNGFQARRLPQSNFIVVLGPNCVIKEQGTYEQLTAQNGYVRGLVPHEKPSDTQRDCSSQAAISDVIQELSGQTFHSSEHQTRGTTDLSVWKYYASALGWQKMAVLVLFLIMESGFGTLRCMSEISQRILDISHFAKYRY